MVQTLSLSFLLTFSLGILSTTATPVKRAACTKYSEYSFPIFLASLLSNCPRLLAYFLWYGWHRLALKRTSIMLGSSLTISHRRDGAFWRQKDSRLMRFGGYKIDTTRTHRWFDWRTVPSNSEEKRQLEKFRWDKNAVITWLLRYGSVGSEEYNWRPFRIRSRSTWQAGFAFMIFAIACWMRGFMPGNQFP